MSYHYLESGLPYVWLEDGYTIEEDEVYGKLVSIEDVQGLHDAIGRFIIDERRTLIGAEFRFLRTELEWSQKQTASITRHRR